MRQRVAAGLLLVALVVTAALAGGAAWLGAREKARAAPPPYAPSITLDCSFDDGYPCSDTFSGVLDDPITFGQVVEFSGIPSLEGETAVVQGDGSFSISVLVGQADRGSIATVTCNLVEGGSVSAECVVDVDPNCASCN